MTSPMAKVTDQARRPRLDQHSRNHIGIHLRVAFEGFGKEPIPEEHVYLLLALRQTERKRQQAL